MRAEQYQPRLDVTTLSTHNQGTRQRTVEITCENESVATSGDKRRGYPVSLNMRTDSVEELEQKKHLLGFLARGTTEVSGQ